MYVPGQHMVGDIWRHNTAKIWLRVCLQTVASIQVEQIWGVEPAWSVEVGSKCSLQPIRELCLPTRQKVGNLSGSSHLPQTCTQAYFLFPPVLGSRKKDGRGGKLHCRRTGFVNFKYIHSGTSLNKDTSEIRDTLVNQDTCLSHKYILPH